MKQIAEMFYKLYENSQFKKDAVMENYDSKTKKFFSTLSKEQFGMFLEVELEYLNYSYICAEKAIEFMLSLLIDEE